MVVDDFNTLKAHGAWFRQRTCGALSDRAPHHLEAHWRERAGDTSTPAVDSWKCMGPFDVAGRTTALAVHPGNPELLFAGSANGGVWRSDNGGGDWKWKWIQWGATAIGALAFDPTDADTVYAATGEANGSVDAYAGAGLYVTRDLGESWALLAPAGNRALPRRIGALVPHPAQNGVLWLGGVSEDDSEIAGLYYSSDSGATWQRENFFSHRAYSCHSIAFYPDGSALVSIDSGGLHSGIWRRAGRRWTQLAGGLPSGDQVGRISLAIGAKDPHPAYALVASRYGKTMLGVYRSNDRGEHWENVAGEYFAGEGYLSYNNAIAVRPDDPETVVCAAKDVHITRDGGATWRRATHRDAKPESHVYVHADHHAIALPGGDLIYSANDGGVARSDDFGATWKTVVHNMCTTMFYDIDVCPQDASIFGGGAQDNGCLLAGVASANGSFLRLVGGDGSAMVFDPKRLGHAYAARTDLHLVRHSAPKHWSHDTWEAASPHGMKEFEHRENPFTIVAIDPEHPDTVWTGSFRMWRTLDGGHHWEQKSPQLDGTGITAIEVAGKSVFAGTAAGGIFRSEDGGETWSGDLSGPEIPSRLISRIEAHPEKSGNVVVTLAGSGIASILPPPDNKPRTYMSLGVESICHVYHSEDNGSTWRAIDPPGHPDVACHAAVFERRKPHRLFIANDCGVWMIEDLARWSNVTGNLPNVTVSDLVYHDATRTLWAATYGRGIWRMHLD
jgi:photosystem II stability/assembly factor-like uncharacterized protein